eukprot:jgi/Chrzof1/6550/Cz19g00220.t1
MRRPPGTKQRIIARHHPTCCCRCHPGAQSSSQEAFKAQECEQCGENNNGLDNSDQASAAHCLSSCMELFRAGRLDDVIGYLSQDLMVHTVVKKGPTLQGRSLSFQDVLDHAASTRLVGYACTTAATAAPLMDSFALRHLVFKSPERVQPLSSMLLEQQHR